MGARGAPVQLSFGHRAGGGRHVPAKGERRGVIMAEIQRELLHFHEQIRQDVEDPRLPWRSAATAVLAQLRAGLAPTRRGPAPRLDAYLNGAHGLGTAIWPLSGPTDLDLALRVHVRAADTDPAELKGRVARALGRHQAEVGRVLVRVGLELAGGAPARLDLALYTPEGGGPDALDRLALGHLGAPPSERVWLPAEALGLARRMRALGPARPQVQRVSRALKRWAALRFPAERGGPALGLGLTVAALEGLGPVAGALDDRSALRAVVDLLCRRFRRRYTPVGLEEHVDLRAPFAPFDEVFVRLNNIKISILKESLCALRDALDEAGRARVTTVALDALRPHLGDALGR